MLQSFKPSLSNITEIKNESKYFLIDYRQSPFLNEGEDMVVGYGSDIKELLKIEWEIDSDERRIILDVDKGEK